MDECFLMVQVYCQVGWTTCTGLVCKDLVWAVVLLMMLHGWPGLAFYHKSKSYSGLDQVLERNCILCLS